MAFIRLILCILYHLCFDPHYLHWKLNEFLYFLLNLLIGSTWSSALQSTQ